MRRPIPFLVVAFPLVILVAGGPAFAATERVKIGLSAWPGDLSGTQRVDSETVSGSTTDMESTLGLEGETTPDFHAMVKMVGPVRLVGSYFTTMHEGDEILTQSLTFDGTTFSAGEDVHSEVDMTVGRLLVSFAPVNFERITLGLGVGAELLDISSEISSTTTGSEIEDITAPVPVVGMNLTLRPIKKLNLYVEASGLSVGVGSVDAKVMDGMIRAEYYFTPWVALTGGYRVFNIDVEEDDFGAVDLEQDGAQIGLVFRL